MMKMIKAVIAAFLVGLLSAGPAWAVETVLQGAGNPNTQGWKMYLTAPPSGASSSSLATSTPSATSTSLGATGSACTAVGGAGCTVILAAVEVLSWSNIAITIRNSGANAFTNVLVEFSPDATNWEIWDSTTFATLASGAILSINISGNARRYLRIEAKSASGSSAVVNLNMNDG